MAEKKDDIKNEMDPELDDLLDSKSSFLLK